MKKIKFYVVFEGREPGIYDNWIECEKQVKGYKGAKFKSYESPSLAHFAWEDWIKKAAVSMTGSPIWNSISVDASCIGNPGIMEFRGVMTDTREVLFAKKYPVGTNNIGEFLGLVTGLVYCKTKAIDLPIYTDSMTALSWVEKRKCNTGFFTSTDAATLQTTVNNAESILAKYVFKTQILKWDTKSWGEIPADYGRK